MQLVENAVLERDQVNIKAWFPYGRKRVVTVVEIGLHSISTTFTTRLRPCLRPYGNQALVLQYNFLRHVHGITYINIFMLITYCIHGEITTNWLVLGVV